MKVLVTGATGAQGGSVARHLMQRGTHQVRAMSRNPESERARELAAAGAEVVQGDLADRGSLKKALEGCDAVFGVTSFWEHFGGELEQGRNLIDAVAEAKTGYLIFSALPSYVKLSGGELQVPHCDMKAELEDYSRSLDLPATYLHVAFYYENFLTYFPPQRQSDGTYSFGFPQGDTPLAAVAVEDVGGIVAGLLDDPSRHAGKVVGAVGDDRPCADYAAAMTRILGAEVRYNHIPREVFASFGFPGAEELANMFDVQRRFIPNRRAALEESRRLYPEIRTFEQWLTTNRGRFDSIVPAA